MPRHPSAVTGVARGRPLAPFAASLLAWGLSLDPTVPRGTAGGTFGNETTSEVA